MPIVCQITEGKVKVTSFVGLTFTYRDQIIIYFVFKSGFGL
jgi:hypothetical protein